mmetsp:Transcript_24166/g.53582  ORF Transcript_24166/g.53582 Transcript_24166/m.53582 type:complete len:304 (+) Transcript_24166:39-950(+)
MFLMCFSHAPVLFTALASLSLVKADRSSTLSATLPSEGHWGYKTVLVFGDSFGDTGPTYHVIQDAFDERGIPAVVKSTAVSGTSACSWAEKDFGFSLVKAAREEFPDRAQGPDFVWYTLGADDISGSSSLKTCFGEARSDSEAEQCVVTVNRQIVACSELLLDNYFRTFPYSKVLLTGYDAPCESDLCLLTLDRPFDGRYCGLNRTCSNSLAFFWEEIYIRALTSRYKEPSFTGVNLVGTSQVAAGVPGARVGKPVLDQGSPCQWMTLCLHPSYGTPTGRAWGETMWNVFFSRHVEDRTEINV